MFMIYDTQGRKFHDTLEKLHQASPPPAPTGQTAQTPKAAKYQDNTGPAVSGTYQKSLASYQGLGTSKPRDPPYHVYEIMSDQFTALSENMTVIEALVIMEKSAVSEAPVLNQHREIVGLFQRERIVTIFLHRFDQLNRLKLSPIRPLLQTEVIATEPTTSIRRAAQVMSEYRLNILPVVDKFDTLAGVITLPDLLSALCNDPPISTRV